MRGLRSLAHEPPVADHLFVAVGDVSGKGVDASLFMALGKALCKSSALRGETDIGVIVTRANREISREKVIGCARR